MPFPTRQEWTTFVKETAARDAEVERLVRAFFENRRRAGAEALELGDPGVSVREHTPQEKVELRTKIVDLLNATAAAYTAAATQVGSP